MALTMAFRSGEAAQGLTSHPGDALLAHPANHGQRTAVYDVLAVLRLCQRDLDVEEAVGEHDDVNGSFMVLTPSCSRRRTLLLAYAAHGVARPLAS